MSGTIISFGDMLWDLFPEGPRFGGAPGNYACHAARLGGEVYMPLVKHSAGCVN